MNLPRDSILVIPAGLDEARFLGLGTEAVSLAERLGLFGADPLLLMPVRLIPRKNIELGLRTLAELRREQLAAMMVVTGPPRHEKRSLPRTPPPTNRRPCSGGFGPPARRCLPGRAERRSRGRPLSPVRRAL